MTQSDRNPTRNEGFTLVEVMIAVGIMTVGSLGILSMHSAVTRANREAREMNMALAVTETWMERIERDSLLWTQPELNTPEILGTEYLRVIGNLVDETAWFTPTPTNTAWAAGFDFFGQDTRTAAEVKYCVNVRLAWHRQGRSARVDVRTYWLREDRSMGGATPAHPNWVDPGDFRTSNCTASDADSWSLGDAPNINVIYASTIVGWIRRDPP
ncbi:MAG: prepilin-type N-terminal cleavage/methylation domain-containing protein [Myxococcota bacterium]